MKLGVRSVYTSWVLVAMIAAVVMMAAPGSAVRQSREKATERKERRDAATNKLTDLWGVLEKKNLAGDEGIGKDMLDTLYKLTKGDVNVMQNDVCVKWRGFILAYVDEKCAQSATNSNEILRREFEEQDCMRLLQLIADDLLEDSDVLIKNPEVKDEVSLYSIYVLDIINTLNGERLSEAAEAKRNDVMKWIRAQRERGDDGSHPCGDNESSPVPKSQRKKPNPVKRGGDDESIPLPKSQRKKPNLVKRAWRAFKNIFCGCFSPPTESLD